MNTGFSMRRLVVSGPAKADAVVTFEAGLNVVVGPSDTGKTFIFQCLDYALGSSSPPKEIPQSDGYETVELTLLTHSGREYLLTRSLRGGDISLQEAGVKERTLKAKHSSEDPENISSFLLEQSGFLGRRVRTNADGKTREVSFRDIAHLAFVDEASVMDPRSPARTGQFTTATVESRVLRLMLTSEDDSSIVARESPKITKARQDERATLLETLIASTRGALPHGDRAESPDAARRELEVLQREADEASTRLAEVQEAATQMEGRRRSLWAELRTQQSRADVLRELQSRFELLREQYESDLRRLAAIAEVGLRIDQTPEERCPVCGALAEDQQHNHAGEEESPAAIRLSCEAESAKIATLMVDLRQTVEVNGRELVDADDAARGQADALATTDRALEEALRPQVAAAAERFRDTQTELRKAEQALQVLRYEQDLRDLLGAEQKTVRRDDKLPPPDVSSGEAESFATHVETLLKEWHFPDQGRVIFSEADQDLVIGGRHRSTYGKGVLAVTHAAFSLALLRNSLDSSLPTPGVTVIDSPLVVYRQPDPEDGEFPDAVKDLFYRSLAQRFSDGQVLIFENEPPPADLAGKGNVISFTKTSVGRYGFIPISDSQTGRGTASI
jgi:hypothetical protein